MVLPRSSIQLYGQTLGLVILPQKPIMNVRQAIRLCMLKIQILPLLTAQRPHSFCKELKSSSQLLVHLQWNFFKGNYYFSHELVPFEQVDSKWGRKEWRGELKRIILWSDILMDLKWSWKRYVVQIRSCTAALAGYVKGIQLILYLTTHLGDFLFYFSLRISGRACDANSNLLAHVKSQCHVLKKERTRTMKGIPF